MDTPVIRTGAASIDTSTRDPFLRRNTVSSWIRMSPTRFLVMSLSYSTRPLGASSSSIRCPRISPGL